MYWPSKRDLSGSSTGFPPLCEWRRWPRSSSSHHVSIPFPCLNPTSTQVLILASSVPAPSPLGHPVSGGHIYAKFNQILLAAAALLSPQVLATMGIDTASLHSHIGSPLTSKSVNEKRHRMKSRVSEGSADDNKSLQSEPYNQRRMVRCSGLCCKDYPPLQLLWTVDWSGKWFATGR